MWRSVPHTDATFTLTSTSVGPIVGTATSRISAPGLGSGFTTASMVSGIPAAHLPPAGAKSQQETNDFSTPKQALAGGAESSWRSLLVGFLPRFWSAE